MKIAIHHKPGGFSDKWIEYCQEHQINYKLVNCYDSDIIQQLEDCDGLMWHWVHLDSRASLFARQLIFSLEHVGKKVFPDIRTCWHYDDKLGQKYLLEAINAPLVATNVFYDKKQAKTWAKQTTYPKVFKNRIGAGSVNVKLVKTPRQAFQLINKAFRSGFLAKDRINSLKDRFINLRKNRNYTGLIHLLKGFARLIIPTYDERIRVREKGYIYFQEFIPNNTYDIRVVVIGKRAFALKRMVRKNDFRASGSGNLIYDKEVIPIECIKLAFNLAKKLEMQCIFFDFLFDKENLLLIEISYASTSKAYLPVPGFWDDLLSWHEGKFTLEWFIIEDLIKSIKKERLFY